MSSESLCEPLRHPSIELPLKLGSSLLTSKAPGYSRGAVMQSLTAATVMASALARGTCFSSARFILPLGLSPRTTAAGLGLLDQYQAQPLPPSAKVTAFPLHGHGVPEPLRSLTPSSRQRFSSQPSQSWLSKLRAADESDTSTLLRLLRPRHLKGLSEAAQKAALMRVLRASYVMGAADIAVEALGAPYSPFFYSLCLSPRFASVPPAIPRFFLLSALASQARQFLRPSTPLHPLQGFWKGAGPHSAQGITSPLWRPSPGRQPSIVLESSQQQGTARSIRLALS